jgi:hypothetical protein
MLTLVPTNKVISRAENGPKHHSRIPAEIVKPHLKSKIKILIEFFGAKKGICPLLGTSPQNTAGSHKKMGLTSMPLPALEVFPLNKGWKPTSSDTTPPF